VSAAVASSSSLADEIAAAFAGWARPADDDLAGGCTCDDCRYDTEPLRGKTRETAAVEDFYNGRGIVVRVLGDDAFLHYLPVMARVALEHLGEDVSESLPAGIADGVAEAVRERFASSDRWGAGPGHVQALVDRLDATQRGLLVRLIERLFAEELTSLTASAIANLTTGRVSSYSEAEQSRWLTADLQRRGLMDADGNWTLWE